MPFPVTPYVDDSPMKPWPSLAAKAFCLKGAYPDEGILFYYDSLPEGKSDSLPCILLIHGLGDEADSWRHSIPLLNAKGYRVLAPDLPGFGRSVAQGRISIKNHVAAVLRLLEALVPGKPVFVAGNSMGAVVAEAVAVQKQELVRGLILLDGSIPGGPANPGIFALAKLIFSRKWYRAYRGKPESAWASLYPYYADLDSMPRRDRDFLKERVMARVESPVQEQAFFATQRSLVWTYLTAASRFARKIRSYDGIIMLLWGEKDIIMPLSSAKLFQALREDITLEIISGAGHLPHQEKPEETALYITEFIASIQGRRH